MLQLLLTFVFIVALVLVSAILTVFTRNKGPIEKIEKYFYLSESAEAILLPSNQTNTSLVPVQQKNHSKIFDIFIARKIKRNVQIFLDRADIPLTAEEVLLFSLVLIVGVFYITLILTGNIIISLLASAMIILVIRTYMLIKYKKRLEKINEQLADAIDMISGSLKTGYSFLRALEVASKEMQRPISKELMKIVNEIKYGLLIEQAFKNMMERIPIKDLELLVTAIVMQKQTGGNLAEIFDNIADTIRERVLLKREVKTITAQGILSGWIVSLLPVFLILTLMILNPGYLSILFTDKIGIFLLIIAIFNEIIGIIMIRRIVSIEY